MIQIDSNDTNWFILYKLIQMIQIDSISRSWNEFTSLLLKYIFLISAAALKKRMDKLNKKNDEDDEEDMEAFDADDKPIPAITTYFKKSKNKTERDIEVSKNLLWKVL